MTPTCHGSEQIIFFPGVGHCIQSKPILSALYSCITKSCPTFFQQIKKEELRDNGLGVQRLP